MLFAIYILQVTKNEFEMTDSFSLSLCPHPPLSFCVSLSLMFMALLYAVVINNMGFSSVI